MQNSILLPAQYNLSEIFSNAWSFVKEQGKSFSDALRAAWAKAKEAVKKLAIDVAKLSELSLDELKDLQAAITATIQSKEAPQNPNTYEVSWDSGVCDSRKHGKPYIAKLIGINDGKLDREFVNIPLAYGAKNAVQCAGKFTVTEGEIFEAREGGSWKNEYRYFYIAKDGDLVKLGDATKASDKMKVMQYLAGNGTLDGMI